MRLEYIAVSIMGCVSYIGECTAFTYGRSIHTNIKKSYSTVLTMKLTMKSIEADEDSTRTAISQRFSRRDLFSRAAGSAMIANFGFVKPALADESKRPDTLDIDNFLRTGTEAFPMGVSSQAGKSRPQTGVFLRDGTEISRDSRSGNVLAEIVLGDKSDLSAVLVSFSSPWPLAKGSVFDVECRDASTGDGVFLSVTSNTKGKDIFELPSSFFLDQLFAPTGRFSFYGSPTNVKVKKSFVENGKRIIEFSFSNLSQSTQAEIPRNAMLVATLPTGMEQAVVLAGSATATRWRTKGSESAIRKTIDSFNASPSPKTSMKVRAKERGFSEVF